VSQTCYSRSELARQVQVRILARQLKLGLNGDRLTGHIIR
jgi:hypothetical protein